MDILSLARDLVDGRYITRADLSHECGISTQAIHRRFKLAKNQKPDGFVLGVLRTAFKKGLGINALSVILGVKVSSRQITMITALSLYPDLQIHEMFALKELEDNAKHSPLHPMVIKSIIDKHRSQVKAPSN